MSTMTAISFLALSNILSFAFANPVVPAAAVITPRAVLPRDLIPRQAASSVASSASTSDNPYYSWIGYYQDPDATSTYTWMYCPDSSTFTTSIYSSTTLVGCCAPDRCTTDLALTCSGSTAFYSEASGGTSGWDCSTRSCNADTIYLYSTANPTEAMLWYGCNDEPPKFYWQEEPADAAVIETGIVSDTTTSGSTSGPSSTPSPTSSAPSQTGSSAPAVTPTPKKKSSKAWIAGVVVGAVAIIAIAGLAFWLIRNRRKNKETEYKPAPQGVAQVYPAVPPQGYSPGYMPEQPQQGYMGDQQQATAYQQQNAKGYFSPPPPGMQSPPTQYQMPDPHASAYYGQNGAPAQVHAQYAEGPSEMQGSSPTATATNAPAELPEHIAPKPEASTTKTT